jgi:hypothetical protein
MGSGAKSYTYEERLPNLICEEMLKYFFIYGDAVHI